MNTVKSEIDRRKSITARMLQAFKTKGELTTRELNGFGNGCSSRLFELRKEGHVIVAQYVSPGNFRYIYKGQKDEDGDWIIAQEDDNEPFIPPRNRRSFFGRLRAEVQE